MKMVDRFFKKVDTNVASSSSPFEASILNTSSHEEEQFVPKCPTLELDPGLLPMIWEFPVNQKDVIHNADLLSNIFYQMMAIFRVSSILIWIMNLDPHK